MKKIKVNINDAKEMLEDIALFRSRKHYYQASYNIDTGEAWVTEFVDENSYNPYPSHIINITSDVNEYIVGCLEHWDEEVTPENLAKSIEWGVERELEFREEHGR